MNDRRSRKRRLVTTAVLIASLSFIADNAAACSVCYSSTPETRWAYYGTTALMALVPLFSVAGVALWLRRAARAQKLAAGDAEVGSRAA